MLDFDGNNDIIVGSNSNSAAKIDIFYNQIKSENSCAGKEPSKIVGDFFKSFEGLKSDFSQRFEKKLFVKPSGLVTPAMRISDYDQDTMPDIVATFEVDGRTSSYIIENSIEHLRTQLAKGLGNQLRQLRTFRELQLHRLCRTGRKRVVLL